MYAHSYEIAGIVTLIHIFPSNFVIYLSFPNGRIAILQYLNENFYPIGDSLQHRSVPSVM